MKTATDFTAEVNIGLAQEERILERWAKHHESARGFLKGGEFDDFDFVIFDKTGIVACYLEVKFRRQPLAMYGDAMFSLRKHVFAIRVRKERKTPVLAVTEYSCGALVEVNLADLPSDTKPIRRRDRPGMQPVMHVFYDKGHMTVLESESR